MKSMLMLVVLSLSFHLSAQDSRLNKRMIQTVDFIESIFDTMYAPKEWKAHIVDWSLESEANKMRSFVTENNPSVDQFQKALAQFFYATADYHVGFRFHRTEEAKLPLTIRGASERYFIVHVDRKKLPLSSFPFNAGTEVVAIDGAPIHEVVGSLAAKMNHQVELTDKSLAELALTHRRASRGLEVPRGPVTFSLIKKGEKKATDYQLVWDHTAETIRETGAVKKRFPFQPQKQTLVEKLNAVQMVSDMATNKKEESNLFSIGGRESYVPELGKKIWKTDKDNHFDAYIYKNEAGKLIGVVRVPKYGAGEKESFAFRDIMKHFSEVTDALVIDQVNNPGGSVFYLYSLVSMLTDKAFATPRHHMTISQKDVREAQTQLEALKKVKTDEEAQKLFGGKTANGFPVNMLMVQFTMEYFQFLIDEWNAGRQLTTPYFIWGADKINPHPEVNYTKPILLLVNELDFSGGDFFPAILQDNKRVTILGTRTAGAGGYVLRQEIPNLVGLELFSVTGSLAKRVNDNPIENLGVTPDVEYSLTPEDFQNGFEGYKKKIQATLKTLL